MSDQTPELPVVRNCAVMAVHNRLMLTSEEYRTAREQIEDFTNLSFDIARALPSVFRIPMVVHVVWNQPNQNISDEQINTQIDVLNCDFRRTNSDVSQVPGVWTDLVADSHVEFFLADKDPNGAPTNGITRTQTNRVSFGADDAVKFSARGGIDAWPTDHYLNIWVCQLGGGLLGYAQFPGGPADTDGVVITHTGFGTIGSAAAPFNLGRTATHEIGHFLNLFHIWGDDGRGCSGSDQCDDTPNCGGPNFGAPNFPHVTCKNGPNGDMFMNYMDYVDDRAMFMFTEGQKARMTATLIGPRVSLSVPMLETPRPSGPVTAWDENRLDAFVIGTDSAVYHKWWDGANWGPSMNDYESLAGVCTSPVEAVSWGPGRLDLFVYGTDSALYHKFFNGAWGPSQTDWESLGGVCREKPRAVSWGANRLDIFIIGTDSAVYHKYWDGAQWGPSATDYEFLGGISTSPVEAVAWGENRLDLFVIGIDSAMYHKWWDGNAWGPSATDWEYMGGICSSPPKVVAWGKDRLDLFVLGTDNAVYHKWWDGAQWGPSVTDWERLGGICTSPVEAVAWGENRLDLFTLGTDQAMYHKWWDGANWRPSINHWEYMGGICTGGPKAVAWGPNRLDVFVLGTDKALYHKWWDGGAWGPSETDWERQGGAIIDF